MQSRKNELLTNWLGKLIFTVNNFKDVAYHHYGSHPLSLIKFIYYSLFRINTFIVFECDLNRPLPPIEYDEQFKVLKPTIEELDNVRNGKDLPREFYYDKFHGVKTCYLALYQNEIAYIHWVYFKGDYSRFLRLREGVAEINYLTTLPKFRGTKLSSRMLVFTANDFQKLGYKKILIVVHQNTVALIKNIKQAEFREVRRLKVLGPFHRKISV